MPVKTLFFIIFLEGYIVLSAELLAIRLLTPFTGSGADTVSIIIAAVLLPLAFGYYAGGAYRPKPGTRGRLSSVRRVLAHNLAIAAVFLSIGLSYAFLDWSYTWLQENTGLHNRIIVTAVYCAIFLVYPVFLMGQTVPLVSHYFSRQKLPKVAGRILFFSTIGSFMGAVFATLVLMSFFGVHYTVIITLACMFTLVLMLSRHLFAPAAQVTLVALGVCIVLNSPQMMERMGIILNNKYSTVSIVDFEDAGVRSFVLNRTHASVIYRYSDETYGEYTRFIEENFLFPIREDDSAPRDILILGAGGFGLGRGDTKNNYVYVDIDKDLKNAAEEKFLEKPLEPNMTFAPMDARAYLNQTDKKFDMIVLDLCRDPISMADSLVTAEFFAEVRDHLKTGGVMAGNYFGSPGFHDAYSRNLDATMRAAFPNLNRQVIGEFNVWKNSDDWTNIVYSYVHYPEHKHQPYSDLKSTITFDKPTILLH